MSSVSGLSSAHRAHARHVVARGAALLLSHPSEVHYTQSAERWEGIARRLLVSRGEYPHHGDCSSTATWLLWNALEHAYGVRDVVNGDSWRGGFTGTMLQHGKPVRHEGNVQVGDLAIYGRGYPGEHVAVCLGGGVVFSHGSEAGPFKLALHYRPDILAIRRYI
jgi:hypothetical protein